MASSGSREFENKFSDYDGNVKILTDSGKVDEPFFTRLNQEIIKLLRKCENGFENTRDDRDYSVYTGTGGNALLYIHLAYTIFKDNKEKTDQYLHAALEILEVAAHRLKGRRVTFLCGDAGMYALLAVLYAKLGKSSESAQYIHNLQDMNDGAAMTDKSLPDEVLYGRAGYLYALLYVQKELGKDKIDGSIIDQVCASILSSGQHMARHEPHYSSPLMYSWHGKHYVGAAHGIAGIMYLLLQANSPSVQSNLAAIEDCVEFLLSQQFPSGNFHSSIENPHDKLIHWCHGAPGAVHLMVKAYKVFGKEKYLNAARKCGEVVWQRGLLTKGYGLCHGVAGNGYAQLALYKATNDLRYLHRAFKFAEWCFDYGKHGCRTPDTPYSLFEGMAGTVYFLADLLEPGSALFPAFEFGA